VFWVFGWGQVVILQFNIHDTGVAVDASDAQYSLNVVGLFERESS